MPLLLDLSYLKRISTQMHRGNRGGGGGGGERNVGWWGVWEGGRDRGGRQVGR